MPNALDAINGTIQFDEGGIRLDDVSATMGGGQVRFGGRIGFDGYVPTDLNVTARGEDMHLRYPEGIRSVVDMDLAVQRHGEGADALGPGDGEERALEPAHRHTGQHLRHRRVPSGGCQRRRAELKRRRSFR